MTRAEASDKLDKALDRWARASEMYEAAEEDYYAAIDELDMAEYWLAVCINNYNTAMQEGEEDE